jgi:hypothetical protein
LIIAAVKIIEHYRKGKACYYMINEIKPFLEKQRNESFLKRIMRKTKEHAGSSGGRNKLAQN